MDKHGDVSMLWQRIFKDGDVKAFESFYYLFYDPLLKFSMMYVNQREEGEEIVSDVFVKSWMNRSNLQDMRLPDMFLLVALINLPMRIFLNTKTKL